MPAARHDAGRLVALVAAEDEDDRRQQLRAGRAGRRSRPGPACRARAGRCPAPAARARAPRRGARPRRRGGRRRGWAARRRTSAAGAGGRWCGRRRGSGRRGAPGGAARRPASSGRGRSGSTPPARSALLTVADRHTSRTCGGQVDDHLLPHRPAVGVLQEVHLVEHDEAEVVERRRAGVDHVAQHLGRHHDDRRVAVDGVVAGEQADVAGAVARRAGRGTSGSTAP